MAKRVMHTNERVNRAIHSAFRAWLNSIESWRTPAGAFAREYLNGVRSGCRECKDMRTLSGMDRHLRDDHEASPEVLAGRDEAWREFEATGLDNEAQERAQGMTATLGGLERMTRRVEKLEGTVADIEAQVRAKHAGPLCWDGTQLAATLLGGGHAKGAMHLRPAKDLRALQRESEAFLERLVELKLAVRTPMGWILVGEDDAGTHL